MHEAALFRTLEDGEVACELCAHGCILGEGQRGICGVRECRAGALHSLNYDRVVALSADPMEKKPLYHFLPGTLTLSLAAPGCNFHCTFCQNHSISQVGPHGRIPEGRALDPVILPDLARQSGCRSLSYTYTEPTVFFELARDAGVAARGAGLRNIFVTNGYASRRCLEEGLLAFLDAANVDLKAFSDEFYRKHCGARLQPVLDTIAGLRQAGVWVEVTTLLIPGENDDSSQLRELARFLAATDPDMPWHVTAYHPDYRMTHPPRTPLETLVRAARIGREAGIRYVYTGNLAGAGGEDTCCPSCGETLLRRSGFSVLACRIREGRCGGCGCVIPGVWT